MASLYEKIKNQRKPDELSEALSLKKKKVKQNCTVEIPFGEDRGETNNEPTKNKASKLDKRIDDAAFKAFTYNQNSQDMFRAAESKKLGRL